MATAARLGIEAGRLEAARHCPRPRRDPRSGEPMVYSRLCGWGRGIAAAACLWTSLQTDTTATWAPAGSLGSWGGSLRVSRPGLDDQAGRASDGAALRSQVSSGACESALAQRG